MRKLTEYEKQKWFDELGRFEAPQFLMDGSELGYAYQQLEDTERCGTSYGLSQEVVDVLRVEILQQYYDQYQWIYVEQQQDPEEYGLPAYELLPRDLPRMEQWDWAMDWRDEHLEETSDRIRVEQLRKELARLERK